MNSIGIGLNTTYELQGREGLFMNTQNVIMNDFREHILRTKGADLLKSDDSHRMFGFMTKGDANLGNDLFPAGSIIVLESCDVLNHGETGVLYKKDTDQICICDVSQTIGSDSDSHMVLGRVWLVLNLDEKRASIFRNGMWLNESQHLREFLVPQMGSSFVTTPANPLLKAKLSH